MTPWFKTVRLTAKLSPSGHRRLDQIFGMCAELYNANLESWRGAYAWWKEHHNPDVESFPSEWNLSLFDRMMMFTGVRADHPEWERLSVKVGRGVLARFDHTIASFYERCKEGKKPGFPRFKPSRRWRSIEVADSTPSMLVAPNTPKNQSAKWWRLFVKGVPRLRFHDKGNRMEKAFGMGATVKELRVVRTPLRVELHVVLKHPDRELPKRPVTNPVGIDKGIKHRMTLSDGTRIPARTVDLKTIIKKQKRLSRAIRVHQDREKAAGKRLPHSNTRKKKQEAFARAWKRETDRARNADFRFAHWLVSTHDAIFMEKLNVAGLARSKRFSKKLHEQRWGTNDQIVEHKAGKAGVPFVMVNPAYTSTDCSSCGHRQPMPLEVRVYECLKCGLVMCRDRNAAINISVRGMETLGSGGTASRRSSAIQVPDVRPGSPPGEQGGPDTAEQYRTAAA